MKILHVVLSLIALFSSVPTRLNAQGGRGDNNSNVPTKPELREVGVSKDGKLVLAGDTQRNIWIWDVPKRELIRVICDPFESHDTLPCYSFSEDGKYALVGNQAGNQRLDWAVREPKHERLTMWDLSTGQKVRVFDLKDESVFAVAFSPDGQRAFSAGISKIIPHPLAPKSGILETSSHNAFPPAALASLRVWDLTNGKLINRVDLEDPRIDQRGFSSDGKFFVSPVNGPKPIHGEKQSWFLNKRSAYNGENYGAKTMSAEWLQMSISCFVLSPDGLQVAVASGSRVGLWDFTTGKLLWHYSNYTALNGGQQDYWLVRSLAFSHDGKHIAASGQDGFLNGKPTPSRGGVSVLDAKTGKPSLDFAAIKEWVRPVTFSHDGKTLIGGCSEGVRFWSVRTGEILFTLKS